MRLKNPEVPARIPCDYLWHKESHLSPVAKPFQCYDTSGKLTAYFRSDGSLQDMFEVAQQRLSR